MFVTLRISNCAFFLSKNSFIELFLFNNLNYTVHCFLSYSQSCTFIKLCNHNTFHHPERNAVTLHCPPHLSDLYSLSRCAFLDILCKSNHKIFILFFAWLLRLSLMFSRFIHVSVLVMQNNIPLYEYNTSGLSIH